MDRDGAHGLRSNDAGEMKSIWFNGGPPKHHSDPPGATMYAEGMSFL